MCVQIAFMALSLNCISQDGATVVVICFIVEQNLKVNNTNSLATLVFTCYSQGIMVVLLVFLLYSFLLGSVISIVKPRCFSSTFF